MHFPFTFHQRLETLRESRLVWQRIQSPEVAPERLLEALSEDNADVERLEQAVGTLDENSPTYRAMLERSKSLTEQQRTVIDTNCRRLQERAAQKADVLQRISLLQNGIHATRQVPDTPVPASEKNAFEKSIEWVGDKAKAGWDWTKEHPTEALVIGGTVTVGIYSLYRLWKWWRGEKKEEKGEKKSGSWWWAALLGVPVVGAIAYYGGKWIKGHLTSFDQAKKMLADAEKRLKSMVGLGNKGAQYGLQEEEYHDAVRIYDQYGDSGAAEIGKVFGANAEGRDKFLADMRQKTNVLPHNGIDYQKVGAALKNYELGLEAAAKAVESWLENHKTEVLIGSVLAVRFGILQSILRGSSSVATKALALGNTMRRWMQHHPLASLFMLGGAAAGTFAAVRALKGAHLPRNLQELAKACAEQKELVVGATASIAKEQQDFLYDCGSHLVGFTGDVSAYVQEQFGNLSSLIAGSVSKAVDSFALTKEEAIAEKQEDCTMILRLELEGKMEEVRSDQAKKNAGGVQKYERALQALEKYSDAMIRRHSTDLPSSAEAEQLYGDLEASLLSLDSPVELVRSNGIVQWRWQGATEATDLSIDPVVSDRTQAYKLSKKLWHGESAGSRIASAVLQETREVLQQHLDKHGSGIPAVLLGSILYVWDEKAGYFAVPFELADDILFSTAADQQRNSWQVTLGNGIATTALFTISVEAMANIKRLVVGGGAMRWRGLRTTIRFVPGLSQIEMAARIWGLKNEAKVFYALSSQASVGAARRALRVLGKANILPHHLSLIKYSQDPEELIRLARAWNAGGHPKTAIEMVRKAQKLGIIADYRKGMSELRNALRKHVVDERLKITKVWDPQKTGIILGRTRVGAEADLIFDQVADALAPSSVTVTPPPLPATPPVTPSPAGAASTGANAPTRGPSQSPHGSNTSGPRPQPQPTPQTQPAPVRSAGTGTTTAESAPVNSRMRGAPSSTSATHEPLPAGVQSKAEKALGGLEADLARTAEKSESARALRASPEVRQVLTKTPLDPKLAKLAEESPAFAKSLAGQLEASVKSPRGVAQAEKIVSELNSAARATEDMSFMGKVMSTEGGCARVVRGIEAGKPVAKALAQASRVSRMAQTLKFAGKTVPLALDAFAAYASVLEMMETSAELARLRSVEHPNAELIRKTEQKYLYQGAQFAVSGVGAAAGGCLLIGVGTTVAAPVMIVTLPISAVIGGAYAAHNWDVKLAHSVEDWRDVPIQQRLVDLRSYSFEERTGHAARTLLVAAGESEASMWGGRKDNYTVEKEWEQQNKEIRQLAETQILSIIKDTTTVGVPAKVRDPDGTVRDPNPEEIKQYTAEVERYVDARLQYFMSQRPDSTHAVRDGDIVELIENSEYAGQLAKDRPALEKALQDIAMPADQARHIRSILEEKDPVEQAKKYKKFAQHAQVANLYAMLRPQALVMQEQAAPVVQMEVKRLLNERIQPALINFYTRCEEENFVDWGSDGYAPFITKSYAEEHVEQMIEKSAAPIVQMMLAQGGSDAPADIASFQKSVSEFQLEAERFLSNPVTVWKNMPKKTKEYKLLPEQQRFTEQQREIVRKGEALMERIGANYNGSYYTKQYGWVGNKFLYIRFDAGQSKWLVGLWSKDDAVHDPASYSVDMWGGADKYNALIKDLASINHGREPSQ